MASKEKRSFVRGYFPFQVRFRIVEKEECEAVWRTGNRYESPDTKILSIDGINADKSDRGSSLDSDLVELLLYIDEKLDHIIKMLSKPEDAKKVYHEGKGLNISGSGMKLEVYRQVQAGQIIHAHFVLSKFPLVAINALGEVVRVKPVGGIGEQCYRLGIRFLNLSESDREKVISCVFRRQREVIRGRRDGELKLETPMK
jgi:hypothetical protein